uniref:Ig-like domain-containing protein n=1 Tax=Hucho hucho TaxID=62062 RepID=A0A4W5JLL2_9TELE
MIIYWTVFLFYANFGCALNKDVIQPDPLIVTHLGQSVSLTCFCRSTLIRVSWFKQTVGQKPLLMVSSFHRTQKNLYFNNFTKDFTETKRLNVKRGADSCNLTISKTELGDSATYYCGAMKVGKVTFGKGTVLIVKRSESNSMYVLQQPVSESVQPGDSVTLNCTIHTETCAGEHSVYWFRHGTGESRPGIIYTHGDNSNQCEKRPESPTKRFVYNLPKRNLSLSDAGTYYCAVASFGEILFGNGTKLDVDYGCKEDHLLLVYCLGVALALCVILIIVLCCLVYKMTKKTSLLCSGMHPQPSNRAVPSSQDQEHDDTLTSVHYAAVNVIHKKPKTQRQRSTVERDTVYSGVRCQNTD